MNTFMYKVKSQGYALALMSAEQFCLLCSADKLKFIDSYASAEGVPESVTSIGT
jgi:hypothetical protein